MSRHSARWPVKRTSRRRRSRPSARFVERLEDRRLLSGGAGSDDFGNDFDQAASILLSNEGSASQAGSIDVAGDIDVFRFVAPVSGQIDVRLTTTGPGSIPLLFATAFDNAGQAIGQNFSGGSFS